MGELPLCQPAEVVDERDDVALLLPPTAGPRIARLAIWVNRTALLVGRTRRTDRIPGASVPSVKSITLHRQSSVPARSRASASARSFSGVFASIAATRTPRAFNSAARNRLCSTVAAKKSVRPHCSRRSRYVCRASQLRVSSAAMRASTPSGRSPRAAKSRRSFASSSNARGVRTTSSVGRARCPDAISASGLTSCTIVGKSALSSAFPSSLSRSGVAVSPSTRGLASAATSGSSTRRHVRATPWWASSTTTSPNFCRACSLTIRSRTAESPPRASVWTEAITSFVQLGRPVPPATIASLDVRPASRMACCKAPRACSINSSR